MCTYCRSFAGDFCSLYQKPRSASEEPLFLPGLRASNVWYGHELSVCWMQTELPEGFAEKMKEAGLAETYEESGWCFVEAAISAGVKVGKRRLDLGKRTERAMRNAYGGLWGAENMLEGVCAAARLPPLLPDEVRRLLECEKKFTASADVDVVDGLYRRFFEGITSAATHLDMSGLRWGEVEARQLVGVLPRFEALTSLDLSKNKLGAKGAQPLAEALKSGSSALTSLDLSDNYGGPEFGKAIAEGIKGSSALKTLNLRATDSTRRRARRLPPPWRSTPR